MRTSLLLFLTLSVVPLASFSQKNLECMQGKVSVYTTMDEKGPVIGGNLWKISVEVVNDELDEDLYYSRKSGIDAMPGTTLRVPPVMPPFLVITVDGDQEDKDKVVFRGKSTRYLTQDSVTVFRVDGRRRRDSFTTVVPKGGRPIIKCRFEARLEKFGDMPIRKYKATGILVDGKKD